MTAPTYANRLRLVSTTPAPVVPARPPLISSEARRNEREGKRPYARARLEPEQIPATFRALTAYPKRVVRRHWRAPVAVVIGALVGVAALGLNAGLVSACAVGAAAGLSIRLMDGWSRS